jgi:hypothetical protein
MDDLLELLERREELCKYRDGLADLYNIYIQKLVEHENDEAEFNKYCALIEGLEPETRITKEKMREINREIQARTYNATSL